MILSNAQRNAVQRAQAGANDVRPLIEYLEQLGAVDPRIRDRIASLRVDLDYLTLVANTALDLDRNLGGS